MIPLSVPEVRRLVLGRDADSDTQAFLLGWSRFRRAHQAVAQRGHVVRRQRERQEVRPSVASALARPAVPAAGLTDAEWERLRPLLPPQWAVPATTITSS